MNKINDVLAVFAKDFERDLDIRDIANSIMLHNILSHTEMNSILQMPSKRQVQQLFIILRGKPAEKLETFVNKVLRESYDFLNVAINIECKTPSEQTEIYKTELRRLRNSNHSFNKYNVTRMEWYDKLMQALLLLMPAQNVVIEGSIGAGKYWLTLDVCYSFAVQKRMNFKIFWLNVLDCNTPEQQLQLLQSLFYQIDADQASTYDRSSPGLGINQRIVNIKAELRRLLHQKGNKDCLLVLRNVQDVKTVKVFNLDCKILLTTRSKCVVTYLSPATTNHLELNDELTLNEVESLFSKHLTPDDMPSKSLLTDLVTLNPCMLVIIAESIRDRLANWDNWKRVKYGKLTTIIEKSLNKLCADDRKLFNVLFIFPEGANIPIKLVNLIWSFEDSMPKLQELCKKSLVEISRETIKLPRIYWHLNLSIGNERELHKKIVDFYNIPKILDECGDTTLCQLDDYFCSHIGHHLSILGDDASKGLLSRIFLDFRFLDYNIRRDIECQGNNIGHRLTGSILNTLLQLRFYAEQIGGVDPYYKRLLEALQDFLPKVEEKLVGSKYSGLLCVALMAEEKIIYDEAFRQVQRFPDHVWLTEHGRFHQHRYIISLAQHQVRHVIYLDYDYCLLAVDNHSMLLIDVSLNTEATCLLSDGKDDSQILQMQVFNNQEHLLTRHSNGSLKLWCLSTMTLRRRDRSNHHNCVQPPQLVNVLESTPRRTPIKTWSYVSAIYVDENTETPISSIQLHVASNKEKIEIYDWHSTEKKFERSSIPHLNTAWPVKCFACMPPRFYVLCSADCRLSIVNLRNSSEELQDFKPPAGDKPLSMEVCEQQLQGGVSCTVLLLICKFSVWRLRIDEQLKLQAEQLQLRDMHSLVIKCAKSSQDGHYLILGTEGEGLIVYDLLLDAPVLQSNVSECITCVDIYKVSDAKLKYIVPCGAEDRHLLHLHILQQAGDQTGLTWLHNVDDAEVKLNAAPRACLEPCVYLRPIMNMTDDDMQLYAVDSRQRVHQIFTQFDRLAGRQATDSHWTTISSTKLDRGQRITALCSCSGGQIYVGCENGSIIDVDKDLELTQKFIDHPIIYMVQLNPQTLVASDGNDKTLIISLPASTTVGLDLSDAAGVPQLTELPSSDSKSTTFTQLGIGIMRACLFAKHFVILFYKHGVVYLNLLELKDEDWLVDDNLVGFDLQGNKLFLVLNGSNLEIYQLSTDDERLSCKQICNSIINQSRDEISYLVASNDGTLFALGYGNGKIELYTHEAGSIKLIYSIDKQVHRQPIRQLRFSPCKQVLVSCANSLCFWSVTYMLNNQLVAKTTQQRSERFSSTRANNDVTDAARITAPATPERRSAFLFQSRLNAPLLSQQQHDLQACASVWQDKRGNSCMPCLLACIKFQGKEAPKFFANANFTQFYAIDNEGVYYHLRLLQTPEHEQPFVREPNNENIAERRLIEHDIAVDDGGIDVAGNALVPESDMVMNTVTNSEQSAPSAI